MRLAVAGLALGLALAACGGGEDGDAPSAVAHPRTLCLDFRCGTLTPLLMIPDAENLIFSPEGRLFVSGGTNVFEVVRDPSGEYVAVPLSESGCNFTGLAIRAGHLYANCFDGRLYGAPLDVRPRLQPIAELGVAAPNGLTVGPDDALYLVNGPFATTALPDPRMLRVSLAAHDPLTVSDISTWMPQGLLMPNGLQAHGDWLYYTDAELPRLALGAVKRVRWTPEGPGAVETLASFLSMPDDLSLLPAEDGLYILAPGFLSGALKLLAPDGSEVAALPPLSLRSPSQARRGQPPLFSPDDILITEKGVLGDPVTPFGNRLSVFHPRVD